MAMGKKIGRGIRFILLLGLLVGALQISCLAATNISMKKTKVKWDLKPEKTYLVKSKYHAVGLQDMKIRMSNYKKKKKNGRVTLSFDVTYDLTAFRPSKSQVHRMIESSDEDDDDTVGGHYECYFIDYNTGRNLNFKNNQYDEWDPEEEFESSGYDNYDAYVASLRIPDTGVRVTRRFKKKYDKRTTYDNDGCYVWLDKQVYHYTVTYPTSYKGLCIGVGGCVTLYTNVTEERYVFGATAFGNLRDYRMRPKNWHFMRVR